MSLQPGASAPDFTLPDQFGRSIRFTDLLAAGPSFVIFFPLAFSTTCQSELGDLRDHAGDFADAGVQLVAVSVDSKHTLRAWADREGYEFPLLADFWPHGEVARAYGAFSESRGYATRASFLVDQSGVVRAAFAAPAGEARALGQYRDALATLTER